MSVSLKKGGNVNLTKDSPNLNKIAVGLGWETRQTSGASFDLDASCFLLGSNGKVRSDTDFIFYNQLTSTCGSVVHQGDNRTGDGDGDDEVIQVNLFKVPEIVERIMFSVTIHDAKERHQNFGQVSNAYIRLINEETGQEVARYDLSEDAGEMTAMNFGELYRHNGDWKFKAVGQGFNDGLRPLAINFGVNVD